ncbi:MAG: flagellar biosynthesis anti-sigma factor FlgM [Sphingomonadales bacterium]|nr:flagellar biosynthesis anti-sigma factor FlgM [Sphingomonadales bacterium]
MVDGVRMNGAAPVDRPARPVAGTVTRAAQLDIQPQSTIAALAAKGAPIDTSRVAAIRAGIADGSYRVDPDAIAARMIEDDLPLR